MKKLSLLLCTILFTFVASAQTKTKNTIINYDYGSENYPGIRKGEVYVTIISTIWYFDGTNSIIDSSKSGDIIDSAILRKNFASSVLWKSKRLGTVAYDVDGSILEDYRPVFAKKSELLRAGVLKEKPTIKKPSKNKKDRPKKVVFYLSELSTGIYLTVNERSHILYM